MDRNTREKLDALSLRVFGSASRWKKILDKGVPQQLYKQVVIPNSETKKLETKQFKTNMSTLARPSLKEVTDFMEAEVKKLDANKATLEAIKKEGEGKLLFQAGGGFESGQKISFSDGTQAEVK